MPQEKEMPTRQGVIRANTASAAEGRGSTSKLVYFFGALGGMLFGYDTGVISGAILFISDELQLTRLSKVW